MRDEAGREEDGTQTSCYSIGLSLPLTPPTTIAQMERPRRRRWDGRPAWGPHPGFSSPSLFSLLLPTLAVCLPSGDPFFFFLPKVWKKFLVVRVLLK